MNKVILEGTIMVPNDDLEAVLQELPIHIEKTLNEEGCAIFKVTQYEKDQTIFHVYEEFLSQEDFDFHQERVRNSHWGKITKNITRDYKITKAN